MRVFAHAIRIVDNVGASSSPLYSRVITNHLVLSKADKFSAGSYLVRNA